MCCVDSHITWIEEADRLTLKVSLLFAASAKVCVTTSLLGSSTVESVLLNTTPISASVPSAFVCRRTIRLH